MSDGKHNNPPEAPQEINGRVWFSIFFADHIGVILGHRGYLKFRENYFEGYFGSIHNGRSIFTYTAPWGKESLVYQGISFWADQPTLIELHVNRTQPGVMINGVRLTDSPEQLQLSCSGNPQKRNAYAPYMSEINRSVNDIKIRRFLQIVAKLEQAALSNDEGDILVATGSLRLLLIEGFADEVNRYFRLKLRYRMPADPILLVGARHSHIPDTYNRPGNFIELNKQRFLNHPTAIINNFPTSIAEIIKLAANSLGVHHFGADDKDKADQELFRFYEGFSARNIPGLIPLMSQILAIVLDALRPLVKRAALEASDTDTSSP